MTLLTGTEILRQAEKQEKCTVYGVHMWALLAVHEDQITVATFPLFLGRLIWKYAIGLGSFAA
jgi:hypothetical protein